MTELYVLNGPDMGRTFMVKEGISYLGQDADNHFILFDKTVSRRHLRILKMGERLLVSDLESRNGTFYNGRYLVPGVEIEVSEGVPLAMGTTLICFGAGCIEQITPFLGLKDPNSNLTKLDLYEKEDRRKSNQRDLRFLDSVCDVLMNTLSLKEAARAIIDHIFALLERIDRAGFVFVDAETGKIKEKVFKARDPAAPFDASFCRDVVNEVLKERRPVVVMDSQKEEDTAVTGTLKVLGIQSVMCIPLISASKVMGTLYIDSLKRPCGFREEDLSLFVHLSQLVAMILEYALYAFQLSGEPENGSFPV